MKKRKCAQCGEPIAEARLEALPDAILCIKCASKNDEPIRKATLEPDPDADYPRGW
jgi:RNA polymerase-binding transcription factor DksA